MSFCTALRAELECTAASKLSQKCSHERASPANVRIFSLSNQITLPQAAAPATVSLSVTISLCVTLSLLVGEGCGPYCGELSHLSD